MQSFFSIWYVRFLSILALIGLVLALMTYAYATWESNKYGMMGPTTINVTGEGEVLAKPDIGRFSFSVRAEGEDAESAQTASAEAINTIIAYLTENGVDEDDIKTEYYNLNPQYRYEERVCEIEFGYCPPGERFVDGFEVNQSVSVKVRDLDNAGNLISGVGERGATNISSLQFTIDDETVLKAEAREKAIEDAKKKAKELARDLDVRLVRMVGYWEDEGGYYPQAYAMDMAMEEGYGGMTKNSAPSIPTGENTITSRVNLTFEIK
ncbi:MAG: SIMPL domain-containing protein [Candidatus Paceibacterota bacterium]